ncbi:hypothetical protein COCC4DRAFT_155332 [Bipolaris maydis ATCC 48331]|uniref:Uncharacterized protein n=2 Tax=Cochliobolus heterostrophus TaxID=5016 RepID=M2TSY1_COCH5|nr:uncharacterized protein COCC4DRAFT_155332 [Bipolaris maydis ATCC 48331]EMD84881.1 hypothetical protein COCHEDRAFT_1120831 [Bipolaris maydis C5]ENH98610.1 hypothetical protein COCC4DRAFT_155332 [Bipolaris maydis ATCC 48331]KAJ6214382.1 hypothetical protein PSV09DRAFT_1120831 [Bipolaris maydis]
MSSSKLGCLVLDSAYANDTTITYLAKQYGFTAAYHRLYCGLDIHDLIGQKVTFDKNLDSYGKHETKEISSAEWHKGGTLGVLIDITNYIDTP